MTNKNIINMNKNEKLVKLQVKTAIQSVVLMLAIALITAFSLRYAYKRGYEVGYEMAKVNIINDTTSKYVPIFIPISK